jgi:anthranilate phosphoribosyltransferase
VVHGGGLDDFTLAADTVAAELHADGRVEERTFSPEAVGLKRAALDAISGGDAQENARLTREVLSGRDAGPHADVVAFNAGAALYLAGLAANVPAGVTLARDTLASGKPLETLEAYAAFTRAFV